MLCKCRPSFSWCPSCFQWTWTNFATRNAKKFPNCCVLSRAVNDSQTTSLKLKHHYHNQLVSCLTFNWFALNRSGVFLDQLLEGLNERLETVSVQIGWMGRAHGFQKSHRPKQRRHVRSHHLVIVPCSLPSIHTITVTRPQSLDQIYRWKFSHFKNFNNY